MSEKDRRDYRVLKLPAVIDTTGLKRDSIYRLARIGKFPKPIKLTESGRASGWLESEVLDWVQDRAASRGP